VDQTHEIIPRQRASAERAGSKRPAHGTLPLVLGAVKCNVSPSRRRWS
jgi:hypothetical protein